MANLKITLPEGASICNGKQLTFRAPCNCNGIKGLVIDGVIYTLLNTANKLVGDSDAFVTGSIVSVMMDVDNKKAYVQNGSAGMEYVKKDNLGDFTYLKDETLTVDAKVEMGLKKTSTPNEAFLSIYRSLSNKVESSDALSDSTKTLYGFGSTSTPDDVFEFLGKYNQHWWKKKKVSYSSHLSSSTETINIIKTESNGTDVGITYGTGYALTKDGRLELTNSDSVNTSWAYFDYNNVGDVLKGKYTFNNLGILYYIPEDVVFNAISDSQSPDGYYLVQVNAKKIIVNNTIDEQFVYSSNRNAYQDSGELNGYEYEYIGIPFDNIVRMKKFEMGSYWGTGLHGSNEPTKLTFSFEPKLLFVLPNDAWLFNGNMRLIAIRGMNTTSLRDSSSSESYVPVNIEWNGKTVSWYTTLGIISGASPSTQLNSNNTEYFYVAFG